MTPTQELRIRTTGGMGHTAPPFDSLFPAAYAPSMISPLCAVPNLNLRSNIC